MHKRKVVLGFDFGMKCIGVAVGQSVTQTAAPLKVLYARDGIPQWEMIKALLEEWHPDLLVVGIPLNMDGTEQAMTHAAKRFANRLHEKFKLEVQGIDERLSTVAAKEYVVATRGTRALQQRVDSVAAQLLIEDWFKQQSRE